MIENYLLKGLMIGIVFGVPAGVVGVLSIQRGLTQGVFAGFLTGVGSSVADVFYASVGVFGITFISDFLLRHQSIICMAGCLTVIMIGVYGILKAERSGSSYIRSAESVEKPHHPRSRRCVAVQKSGKARYLASCFFTAFTIAITNPATILSFMVAFSMFQIEGSESLGTNIQLIAGIFGGTCVWWLIIALAVSRFRNRITDGFYPKLNRVFGVLMILLGGAIGIRMVLA